MSAPHRTPARGRHRRHPVRGLTGGGRTEAIGDCTRVPGYPVRMQPMYLDEVIEEVAAAARVVASTKHVAIEVHADSSASFVGDEELLRRLLANLLDNAVRHSPAGSVVRVELRSAPAGYSLLVADRGSGIPAEHRPHIFERFYRVDASRVRGHHDGGAGLGLSLARWVVTVHGGDITLVDSSEDGTTFSISLPSRA